VQPQDRSLPLAAVQALASLRLTVVLLALAMVLVFASTLAQTTLSTYQVQRQYFHSLLVLIDLPWVKFPFPGGLALGTALLLNLIAAHVLRFQLAWRHVGMWLTHSGIILLLLGGLQAGMGTREAQMSLTQGRTGNYAYDANHPELVVIDTAPPPASAGIPDDLVVAFPASLLHRGATLQHPLLPFTVHVDEFYPNSDLLPAAAGAQASNPADHGIGVGYLATARDSASASEADAPSAYVTLRSRDGTPLGTWLLSLNISNNGVDHPQPVTLAGKTYLLDLRPRRDYKPYSLELLQFTHTQYTGTDTDKSFSSLVRLHDPSRRADRQALISMNHPLRYQGETMYQAQFHGSDTSILLIVRNPAWLMPYVSCTVIAAGLLLHFGLRLVLFLRGARP
jgi:hypothetical protein